MKDHDIAISLFRTAHRTGSLSPVQAARAQEIADNNRSSDNIVNLCHAARQLAGYGDYPVPDRLQPETGSDIVYGWWTDAALSSLPQWRDYCAASAALRWQFLCNVQREDLVVYEHGSSRNRGAFTEINEWRNRITATPAPRLVHGAGRFLYIERSVGGRILAGTDKALLSEHPDLGWAGEIIADQIKMFRFTDPYEALNKFKPPKSRKYWIWRRLDSSWIAVCENVHRGRLTRGPIPLVEYDADLKRVHLVTSSAPTSAGNWSPVDVEVKGRNIKLVSPDDRVIRWGVPTDYELAFVYDDDGARDPRQDTQPSPSLPPPPAPPPDGDLAAIHRHLDVIEAETHNVQPPGGVNHEPCQRIRNRVNAIRRRL